MDEDYGMEYKNYCVRASEFAERLEKFHKINLWYCLLIGVLVLLVVSVAGCGSESNLQEVLSKSIETTSDLESYRSSQLMIQTSGDYTTRHLSQVESIEPDHFREQSIDTEGWSETVIIGDKCYVRNSAQPAWHMSQREYALTALKKELDILHALTNLKELQDEEINNKDCWQDFNSYSNTKTYEQAVPDIADQLKNWKGEVDLWIGKDSYLIHKIKSELRWPVELNGNKEEALSGRLTATKYFYDFNEVSHIEPPTIE
jgi:hypothetical protein